MTRSLSVIAGEIRENWTHVHPTAVPYLDALAQLNKLTDEYHCDSARSIIGYFLANAQSWHGPVARRIKIELNQMLGAKL